MMQSSVATPPISCATWEQAMAAIGATLLQPRTDPATLPLAAPTVASAKADDISGAEIGFSEGS